MKRLFVIIAHLLVLTLSGTLVANAQVSVSPQVSGVNVDGTSIVTLRWRVGVTSATQGKVQVQSSAGVLGMGGVAGGNLSTSVLHPGPAVGTVFVTLVERLRVSRTTAKRISQSGTTTYTRSFSGGSGPAVSARATLRATTGGELTFRNIELRFEDASRFQVIDSGQDLTAQLALTTSGRGVLRGSWEVAGPVSRRGAGFRPIGRLQQFIAGPRSSTFVSPPLPSNAPGVYSVRFVPDQAPQRDVLEPAIVLRYTVVSKRNAVENSIGLFAPKPGESLTRTTQFRWQTIQGTRTYRLEFFDFKTGRTPPAPVAAILSEDNHVQLRDFTFERITSSGELYWRVVSLDSEGKELTSSSVRELK
ncbi:hypothetical protein ACOTTU_24115 [Roseobacter sp. EG26]|uniref:hypothetical protein n=1 Tax=Roseobacter sp. EG26 TaxID=3412477 RepID=UPI003CE51B7C